MPSDGRDSAPSVRQRLLEAANRRFRTNGYDATTAASIAADAGVTERTFFRIFPSKADVLLENWNEYAGEMRNAMSESAAEDACAVVRDGLVLFTGRVQDEFRTGLASAVWLFTDHSALLVLIRRLLDVESDVASEIARRTNRSPNAFEVRLAANASMGVMRAAIRGFVFNANGPSMLELIDEGMAMVRPLYPSRV